MDIREDIEIDVAVNKIVTKQIIQNDELIAHKDYIRKNPKYMKRFLDLIFEKNKLLYQMDLAIQDNEKHSGIFFKEYSNFPIIHYMGAFGFFYLYQAKSNINKALILFIARFCVVLCSFIIIFKKKN